MEIVLSRVDDRLLHGQVATSWVRTLSPQVIVVIDEKLPDDKVQVQILKVAAPPGTKVYVMKPEKITEKIKDIKISEKTVRNHISNTMQKLSVKGRAQAVVELIKLGEITL